MRKVNDMFHIEGEQLVKTSNGQPVPEDEPIFIVRGRDVLAARTVQFYMEECARAGVPVDRVNQLIEVYAAFLIYAKEHTTKIPGSTHGK